VSGRFVCFLFYNEPSNIPFRYIYFSILLSFTLLCFKKYKSGTDVLDLPYSGFGLVFGTWPVVFNQLPGGIHWVRLIFFNLWLLGIDSAFAFLEAFLSVLGDTGTYKIQFNSIRLVDCLSHGGIGLSLLILTFLTRIPTIFYEFSPTTQSIFRKSPVSGSH
jgi:SNF family Na+-dependent transporter